MKKIGGKRYLMDGLYSTKAKARDRAHKLRSKGNKSVRVIKGSGLEKGLWIVYRRLSRQ